MRRLRFLPRSLVGQSVALQRDSWLSGVQTDARFYDGT